MYRGGLTFRRRPGRTVLGNRPDPPEDNIIFPARAAVRDLVSGEVGGAFLRPVAGETGTVTVTARHATLGEAAVARP